MLAVVAHSRICSDLGGISLARQRQFPAAEVTLLCLLIPKAIGLEFTASKTDQALPETGEIMGDREYDDEEHAEDDQDNDQDSYPPEDEDQPDSDLDQRNDRTDSRPDGFFDGPDDSGTIVPVNNIF